MNKLAFGPEANNNNNYNKHLFYIYITDLSTKLIKEILNKNIF